MAKNIDVDKTVIGILKRKDPEELKDLAMKYYPLVCEIVNNRENDK